MAAPIIARYNGGNWVIRSPLSYQWDVSDRITMIYVEVDKQEARWYDISLAKIIDDERVLVDFNEFKKLLARKFGQLLE